MDKKSFLFYLNWEEQVDLMNDVELRSFIKNLCRFANDEEVELKTREEKLCWLGILPALEINKVKYNKKVEANRENGKLGGAPVGNQNARKNETTQNNPNNLIIEKREEIIDNRKMTIEKSEKEKENRKELNETSKDEIENVKTSQIGADNSTSNHTGNNTGPDTWTIPIISSTLKSTLENLIKYTESHMQSYTDRYANNPNAANYTEFSKMSGPEQAFVGKLPDDLKKRLIDLKPKERLGMLKKIINEI